MNVGRRIISDQETEVLHAGLKLLELIGQAARRRVLAYWGARAESLSLRDRKGHVVEEHPEDDEPPMIKFINTRKGEEGDGLPAT